MLRGDELNTSRLHTVGLVLFWFFWNTPILVYYAMVCVQEFEGMHLEENIFRLFLS